MGYLKTKGIVIREVNTGEADKVITIFTRNYGKISGFARGARRPRSSLAASSQFLCYSDFVLFKGKELYNMSSADVIEPFYGLRNDIVKLTYSAHFADILNDTIQENQPATKVLQLFLNTLHFLANTVKSPELLARIFELRLVSIIGYAPYARRCIACETEESSRIYFSFKKCGLLCGSCIKQDPYALEISYGTAKAISHIIYSKLEDLFNFELAPPILAELGKITRRYLKDRFEKEYTKLDFLKELEKY